MGLPSQDEWRVVLGPGPREVILRELEQWRTLHRCADADVLVDFIRGEGGELVRVKVREAPV